MEGGKGIVPCIVRPHSGTSHRYGFEMFQVFGADTSSEAGSPEQNDAGAIKLTLHTGFRGVVAERMSGPAGGTR